MAGQRRIRESRRAVSTQWVGDHLRDPGIASWRATRMSSSTSWDTSRRGEVDWTEDLRIPWCATSSAPWASRSHEPPGIATTRRWCCTATRTTGGPPTPYWFMKWNGHRQPHDHGRRPQEWIDEGRELSKESPRIHRKPRRAASAWHARTGTTCWTALGAKGGPRAVRWRVRSRVVQG